jgi:hypothetical protein
MSETCKLCQDERPAVVTIGDQDIEIDGFCQRCREERRIAWDRFAAALTYEAESTRAASDADILLAERDKRFCRKADA